MVNVVTVLSLGVIVADVVAVVGPVEVVEVAVIPVSAAGGISAVIAIMGVKRAIHMTIKLRTMVPWACAQKHAVGKPLRAIVAVRSAVVRCISVVAIGAYRSGADADANRNLGV